MLFVCDVDYHAVQPLGSAHVSIETRLSSISNQIELPPAADEAVRIVARLQEAGFTAYLAGGCVRDALLGKEPKDYDVATNAAPDTVRQIFGKSKTLAFGVSFGVIGVLPERRGRNQGQATEVATFRSDGSYSDGRRPDSVRFGDPEEDALRRDFTINGLFYDPIERRVIDFVGGQIDLSNGLLRTIGRADDRFNEDRLRMLRAIRFSATLGFQIDPDTEAAIGQHAEAITVVSGERIGAEMRRVLLAPHLLDGLRSLIRTNLAETVLPDLQTLDFDTLAARLAFCREDDFRFPLAVILATAEKSMQSLRLLAKSWRLANEEVRSLRSSLESHATVLGFADSPWSKTQPVMIDRDIEFIINLANCLAASEPESDLKKRFLESLEKAERVLEWPEERLNPQPLIGGDDLRSLGFEPGPMYARVLQEIRDAQLNGSLHTKEDATAWAIRKFRQD